MSRNTIIVHFHQINRYFHLSLSSKVSHYSYVIQTICSPLLLLTYLQPPPTSLTLCQTQTTLWTSGSSTSICPFNVYLLHCMSVVVSCISRSFIHSVQAMTSSNTIRTLHPTPRCCSLIHFTLYPSSQLVVKRFYTVPRKFIRLPPYRVRCLSHASPKWFSLVFFLELLLLGCSPWRCDAERHHGRQTTGQSPNWWN